jgi:hypothetical protein
MHASVEPIICQLLEPSHHLKMRRDNCCRFYYWLSFPDGEFPPHFLQSARRGRGGQRDKTAGDAGTDQLISLETLVSTLRYARRTK